MNDIDENLENKNGELAANLENNIDRIEDTLGRVMQDGKNKPFAHTCERPSQTCECWIAVEGENRVEHIWLSVRPNRRARRYEAAKRKEPKRNDGTPKRFERVVRPGRSKARATTENDGGTSGSQDGATLRDTAQPGTKGSRSSDD